MNKSRVTSSLVVFTIVAAVIAVLIGILILVLTSRNERLRVLKDDSAMSELTRTVALAIDDEPCRNEVVAKLGDNMKVEFTFTPVDGFIAVTGGITEIDYANLIRAVKAQVGDTIKLTSKAHRTQSYKVIIDMSGSDVKVSGVWVD